MALGDFVGVVRMTQTVISERPGVGARRFGYVVGALVNVALLGFANIWPGWEAVPFLTAETPLVMGMVNASIVSNIVANAVFLVSDTPWLQALGSMVTTTIGMLALVRIWQVFPFDFASSSIDWPLVARVVLIVSIVGSIIAIIVAFIKFVKCVVARSD
jgi:hypothetical protein